MKLPKAPILECKRLTPEQADRRQLQTFGRGALRFHVTFWGASAPKVLIEVLANCQRLAEQYALAYARCRWFKDAREIGIERVEWVTT